MVRASRIPRVRLNGMLKALSAAMFIGVAALWGEGTSSSRSIYGPLWDRQVGMGLCYTSISVGWDDFQGTAPPNWQVRSFPREADSTWWDHINIRRREDQGWSYLWVAGFGRGRVLLKPSLDPSMRSGYGVWYAAPYWFFALCFGLLPAREILRWSKRRRRRRRGQCRICGYDLRAAPDRCPECGSKKGPETGTTGNGDAAALSLPSQCSAHVR